MENSSAVTNKKIDEKLLLAADTFAELCVMSSVRCFGGFSMNVYSYH